MTVQNRLAPGKYRLTVNDYLRLDASGIFGTERTELLAGDIIVMNAEYRPHAWVRDELAYGLRRALEARGSDLAVTSGSLHASDHDMPIPDITLTSEPRGEGAIPRASVALVVEVSSTTLRRDISDKLVIYASAGIAEYWIVDVEGRIVHQMWQPDAVAYTCRRRIPFGDSIEAATLEGVTIATTSL